MKYPSMRLEKKLWSEGYKYVISLDEAGRGPWAGPVSVAGVMLQVEDKIFQGVRDSKILTKKLRADLYKEISNSYKFWSCELIPSKEIDKNGIAQSVASGMEKVVKKIEKMIGHNAELLLIDGANVRDVDGYRCLKINKGDANHYSIASASIIAKVTRDELMQKYSEQFPEYGFNTHVGYGTKKHREALKLHGPCDLHRFSYIPIKKLIDKSTEDEKRNWKYWRKLHQ